VGAATKVPLPITLCTTPSSLRTASAFSAVMWLMSCCWLSVLTLGTRPVSAPSLICSRSSAASCRYSGVGEHCAAEGRDYDSIEKTVQVSFDLGENGERVEQTIGHLHELSELGFEVAHGRLAGIGTLRPIDLVGERLIPAIEKFRLGRVDRHDQRRSRGAAQD
jgi:hypothetical protein